MTPVPHAPDLRERLTKALAPFTVFCEHANRDHFQYIGTNNGPELIEALVSALAPLVDLKPIDERLVKMAEAGILNVTAVWLCPNDKAAITATFVRDFPDAWECPCGETHYFEANHIEMSFLPAVSALAALPGPTQPEGSFAELGELT